MKNYSQTNYFNFSSVRESANRTEPKTEEKNRTVENSTPVWGPTRLDRQCPVRNHQLQIFICEFEWNLRNNFRTKVLLFWAEFHISVWNDCVFFYLSFWLQNVWARMKLISAQHLSKTKESHADAKCIWNSLCIKSYPNPPAWPNLWKEKEWDVCETQL